MPLSVFLHLVEERIGEVHCDDGIGDSVCLKEDSARDAFGFPQFVFLGEPVLDVAGEPPMEKDAGYSGNRTNQDHVQIRIYGRP